MERCPQARPSTSSHSLQAARKRPVSQAEASARLQGDLPRLRCSAAMRGPRPLTREPGIQTVLTVYALWAASEARQGHQVAWSNPVPATVHLPDLEQVTATLCPGSLL